MLVEPATVSPLLPGVCACCSNVQEKLGWCAGTAVLEAAPNVSAASPVRFRKGDVHTALARLIRQLPGLAVPAGDLEVTWQRSRCAVRVCAQDPDCMEPLACVVWPWLLVMGASSRQEAFSGFCQHRALSCSLRCSLSEVGVSACM